VSDCVAFRALRSAGTYQRARCNGIQVPVQLLERHDLKTATELSMSRAVIRSSAIFEQLCKCSDVMIEHPNFWINRCWHARNINGGDAGPAGWHAPSGFRSWNCIVHGYRSHDDRSHGLNLIPDSLLLRADGSIRLCTKYAEARVKQAV